MRRLLLALVATAAVACGIGPRNRQDFVDRSGEALTVCPKGSTVAGVDVSSYQGNIDWATAKSTGIDFAYAKATEGLTVQDSTFSANWSGMKANGVIRGAYHFFHPSDDGKSQADYFLSQVGTIAPGDLPPMLDWEVSDSVSGSTAAASGQAFIDEIKAKTGLPTVIYTAPGLWDGFGIPDQFSSNPLWIANYTGSLSSCPGLPSTASWTNWVIWQYSADGTVSGISQGACDPSTSANCVDLDVFNGSLSELQAFANGQSASPCKGVPNGTWCGGDRLSGDADTLYACADGGMSTVQVCAAVCLSGDAGADQCLPELHRASAVDLNGDGKADLCGRGPQGIQCYLSTGQGFGSEIAGPPLSDAQGWNKPEYGSTILYGDINGDGQSDVCARGVGGIQCWLFLDGGFDTTAITGPALSDSSGWNAPEFYSTLQLADVNGDGKADLCARAAAHFQCWLSTGTGFSTTTVDAPDLGDAQGWNQTQYYSTIQLADINGDGKADVCGRGYAGFECWLSTGTAFTATGKHVAELSDPDGGDQVSVFSTIRMGDVNGDGKIDVCARLSNGFWCWTSDGTGGFPTRIAGPGLTDADGWNQPPYFSTLELGDVNGDGMDDVCARAEAGYLCWLSKKTGFDSSQIMGPTLSDASGWAAPPYGDTLQLADVDGDGKADVCGRAAKGWECWLSSGSAFGSTLVGPALSDANHWDQPRYFPSLHMLFGPTHVGSGTTAMSSSSGSTSTSSSTSSSTSTAGTGTTTGPTMGTTTSTSEGSSASTATSSISGGSTSAVASSSAGSMASGSMSSGSMASGSTGGASTGARTSATGSTASTGSGGAPFGLAVATSSSSGGNPGGSSGCGCRSTSDAGTLSWALVMLLVAAGSRRRAR